MGDNLTRYYAVFSALKQLRGHEPQGNEARHLRTMALLISGLVGSRRCNFGAVASKAPDGNQRESRIKRFTRWVQNERITAETYFLPYVQALLASLPTGPYVLVMDATDVGRGCMALVMSVLYHQQKRAIPIAWSVVRGSKGHLGEQVHAPLLRQVAGLLASLSAPECHRSVIVLGDGEFDGVELLTLIRSLGWTFVCRTASNISVYEDGYEEGEETPFTLSWLNIEPGEQIEFENARFTRQKFGPVLVGAIWQPQDKEPLYLVSNCDLLEEALYWYKKRFQIETFFSDQKSRGFHLAHSHLSDPMRLERLLIATCLAYIWIVCLGAAVKRSGQSALVQVHRRKRCDLSLFQLGLLWVEHCLNEGWALPVVFQLLARQPGIKSVR
jgi:hypothetical protein